MIIDTDDVQRLLQNVSPNMPIWEKYKQQTSKTKLYRDKSNEPIGLSVFSTNTFHPNALGLTVYTLSENLFSIILADARKEALCQHKDRIVTWEYEPLSKFSEWLITQGFSVWRRTVMPKAEISNIVLANSKRGQVLTLSQVLKNNVLKNKLLKMSLNDYADAHTANPMRVTTISEWEQIVFPDVLSSAPLVLVQKSQILAYTFLFEDNPKILTLGWLGAINQTSLWDLQTKQLTWAKSHDMHVLTGEFDSTDHMALSTYKHWPFDPAPVYTMVGQLLTNEHRVYAMNS
ncbi:hypothetical protein [Lacticaseibacillus paracasei]|jgi:hypothetical protein|uniref:hypothetical protein n=1 Tax=Lacticaseibacillus paracasei TaxID=1597 RepID=UPI000343AC2B|nr:hypothetical protein [Lacticaseibacillus paracasei]EPC37229.1 hypothetical protein Lpp120_0183 [Lacticaseibacillus paracasei subsp. paracasei Lpp120]